MLATSDWGLSDRDHHRCDTYGCGGADDNGDVWEMACGDGIQTLSSTVCAAHFMAFSGQPCLNQVASNRRRYCDDHAAYEEVCSIKGCGEPVQEGAKLHVDEYNVNVKFQ